MNTDKITNNKIFLFIKEIVENINTYKLPSVSASLTYYFLLCIGPFMMLLLYIGINFIQTQPELLADLLSRFVQNPELIIDPLLDYLSDSQGSGLAILSIVVTLYSASSGSRNLIKSLDVILGVEKKDGIRNIIVETMFAILFTGILIISLLLILSTFVYGDPITVIIDFLFDINLKNFSLWNFITGYLPIIYIFILVLLLYQALSIRRDNFSLSWDEKSIGAAFTTIGWIITSSAYSFYVNNFNTNNIVYGTLGSFMVLMLWIYILLLILLVGAVVVKVYNEYKEIN